MLGSTAFGNALVHLLKAPIEAWEDTLDTNHDDYVYIDGEESDFGIVQYFGTGSDGKTKMLLLVKYVHGGDVENTYFTEEGALVFQQMLSEKMPHAILEAIQENMNPAEGENRNGAMMQIGKIKAEKALMEAGRLQYEPLCIAHKPNFHLPEMVGGAVIKWDDLFFTAFVHKDGRIMFWCEYAKEFLRAGDVYQPYEVWRERFANWEVSMVYHPAGLYDLFKRWEAGEMRV